MKYLQRALKGKLAQHFGLCENDAISSSGSLNFAYQVLAVLFATALVLFKGPQAVASAGLLGMALAVLVTPIALFAGVKLLLKACECGTKRILTKVPQNKALRFAVTLGLILASLGLVMSWPAVFLFALSKLMPATVGFAGWGSAYTAGLGVLACDTILGGLTGVSLLSGKREKVTK